MLYNREIEVNTDLSLLLRDKDLDKNDVKYGILHTRLRRGKVRDNNQSKFPVSDLLQRFEGPGHVFKKSTLFRPFLYFAKMIPACNDKLSLSDFSRASFLLRTTSETLVARQVYLPISWEQHSLQVVQVSDFGRNTPFLKYLF